MFPSPANRSDLKTTADVDVVVRSFYENMEDDPQLGGFFADVDWETHLPKMTTFWSSILFHTGEYGGRPFDPHALLSNLEQTHFNHWLARFRAAVDEHFEGEAAERMKLRAEQIATVFQVKLGLWESSNQSPAAR